MFLLPYDCRLTVSHVKKSRHPRTNSCLDAVEASVWCGVGRESGDALVKYLEEDGDPFIVACCRADFCQTTKPFANHTTLFDEEGFFRTLSYPPLCP